MTQQPPQMQPEFSVAALIRGLTPVLLLPGACALVATAYWLGASWLGNPALGLPAGVWVVILTVAWAKLIQERERHSPARLADLSPVDTNPGLDGGLRWPRNAAASRVLDTTARAASAGVELVTRTVARGVEETLCAWHDRLAWPARPVRVGLAVGPELARSIVECEGSSRVEWFTLPYGVTGPGACERYVLDAAVGGGPGTGVTVFTSVAQGREAAWYDWAGQRPLSYASVFPGRTDAERVTLEGAARLPQDHTLVRALIESAAVLSRTTERLNLGDRIRGRRPLTAIDRLTRFGEHSDPVDECVRRVGELLIADERRAYGAGELRGAARVVSAYLAGRAGEPDESDRRHVESAAEIAGDEPEVMLRLGAVRIGAGDDEGGVEALLEADRLLRGKPPAHSADQLLFVQSEIENGSGGRMTLGRVAAGICILAVTSPAERLAYLRDDLLDEMRHSGWLLGEQADRALLQEVFRALERARRTKHGRSRAA